MFCPNFETCGGELEFKLESEYAGADEWMSFVGYSAECTDQTCDCMLTDEQWEELENQAIEAAAYPYDEP